MFVATFITSCANENANQAAHEHLEYMRSFAERLTSLIEPGLISVEAHYFLKVECAALTCRSVPERASEITAALMAECRSVLCVFRRCVFHRL